MTEKDPYTEIKAHFNSDSAVVVNEGRGAQGIKHNGKMFIMFYKGELLVKLPPARIQELIDSEKGQAFDPGNGKIMKDRVLIPTSNKDIWVTLSQESRDFVVG